MARITDMKMVEKPWGRELVVEHNKSYALKDIILKQGTRSSLQSHNHKLETILVVEGTIELETWETNEPNHELYSSGDAYTIPPGLRHRVRAIQDCRLIEVSTPELDDIVRYADDFGRS